MKTIMIAVLCFSLFTNNPSEAAAVLDNPSNAELVKEKTIMMQEKKEEENPEKNKELNFKKDEDQAKYSSEEIALLARLVHAEAKGEPYKAKIAVAATVLNRVKSPDYPDTIQGVIYQNNYGYQYCPVSNGQINRPADKEAYKAVEEALRGYDPSGGAFSFYNPAKSSNRWIRTRPFTTSIGNHIFVK